MTLALFSTWEVFTVNGKKFLALTRRDGGNVLVIDKDFNNYGGYFSIESFRKFYARDGETLNLGKL